MSCVRTTICPPKEGRRERKRRETRTRIADTAMALFLEKGFVSATIDEIAEAADVSKRSLFDYFATKEDLVAAWQDKFAIALAEAVAACPEDASPTHVVERAMEEALLNSATAESLAITVLIRTTPILKARDQLNYVTLEMALVDALLARAKEQDPIGAKLLAMVAIGALRIGTEEWHATAGVGEADLATFARRIFRTLWRELGQIT